MSELTELERLQKNVVETKAAYAVYDTISDYSVSAYTSYSKARLELSKYLKEHGNELD